MSDNTTLNAQSGAPGDNIATDDLSTINGAPVGTPVKAQRVKVGYGVDGDFNDVDATHGLPVNLLNTSVPVTGAFWQATQPVSLAALPALAAGANTIGSIANTAFGISGTLPAFAATPTFNIGTTGGLALESGGNLATLAGNTTGLASTVATAASALPAKLLIVGGSDGTNARALSTDTAGRANVNINGTVPVSGTFWQATQPVSLAALPALAAGANTIGAISNTSFGISGTLPAFAATPTFNLGTLNGAATDATLTGGTLKAIARGGAKGTTVAADVTSTSIDANTQGLDVAVKALPALATGSNAIGSITNTAFGISGTLPAFAATPTVNLGTLNGAATDASVVGLQVAQGSTTSGQKGGLTLGAVTTAAPAYTTAQSSPLSLTTFGALRTMLTDGTNTPAIKASNAGVSGADIGMVVTFGSAAQAQVVGPVSAGSAIGASAPVMVGGSDGTNVQRIKTDTSGNQFVAGNVASAATDSGNPVKFGGVFNTTQPTVTTGQRVDAQMTARGGQIVATGVDAFTVQPGNTANTTPWLVKLNDGTTSFAIDSANQALRTELWLQGTGQAHTFFNGALADGATNTQSSYVVADYAYRFNGSTWDRARNNWNTTTGDTGAKTATFNGATQTNYDARGVAILVVLGTVSGTTPTLNMQLQWSPDGGTWLNYGPPTGNLTTTGQTAAILVYPTNISQAAGATPANLATGAAVTLAVNAPLPRTWRLVYTIGGTTPSFAINGVLVSYIL